MIKSNHADQGPITPQMTLVEVMFQWRASEAIFQNYEAQAGTCLRCHALFDTWKKPRRNITLI